MHLIIDTDVGIDDVTSILLALSDPSVTVKAITVVDGNVTLPAGLQTLGHVLSLMRRTSEDIQVYAGAKGPLVPGIEDKTCWPGHGTDGLGNFTSTPHFQTFFPTLTSTPFEIQKEPVASALVRLVNEDPGLYTLLALGPLTNLALAISLDPGFLGKVKEVHVMGGCLHARGNANRGGEFNFHADPEAAHILFTSSASLPPSSPPKITLVTWETTVQHALPWSFIHSLLEQGRKKAGNRIADFVGFYIQTAHLMSEEPKKPEQDNDEKKKKNVADVYLEGVRSFLMCDAYSTLACLHPDSILSYKDFDVQIELSGRHSRGMMALDWFAGAGGKVNARVVFELEGGRLEGMMRRAFLGC
ncbi:Envelope glycoprotein [Chytridiales sp. JEL 0842]|nr:Envelope glycoprotein [Chytridiales sp. JEL 0842]